MLDKAGDVREDNFKELSVHDSEETLLEFYGMSVSITSLLWQEDQHKLIWIKLKPVKLLVIVVNSRSQKAKRILLTKRS